MPAKPSGEIKTTIIHQIQKNGDIYVLERKTLLGFHNPIGAFQRKADYNYDNYSDRSG